MLNEILAFMCIEWIDEELEENEDETEEYI